MSTCTMDDWKLKTTPVVKLEMPNKTFVHLFVAPVKLKDNGPDDGSPTVARRCVQRAGITITDR